MKLIIVLSMLFSLIGEEILGKGRPSFFEWLGCGVKRLEEDLKFSGDKMRVSKILREKTIRDKTIADKLMYNPQ